MRAMPHNHMDANYNLHPWWSYHGMIRGRNIRIKYVNWLRNSSFMVVPFLTSITDLPVQSSLSIPFLTLTFCWITHDMKKFSLSELMRLFSDSLNCLQINHLYKCTWLDMTQSRICYRKRFQKLPELQPTTSQGCQIGLKVSLPATA